MFLSKILLLFLNANFVSIILLFIFFFLSKIFLPPSVLTLYRSIKVYLFIYFLFFSQDFPSFLRVKFCIDQSNFHSCCCFFLQDFPSFLHANFVSINQIFILVVFIFAFTPPTASLHSISTQTQLRAVQPPPARVNCSIQSFITHS